MLRVVFRTHAEATLFQLDGHGLHDQGWRPIDPPFTRAELGDIRWYIEDVLQLPLGADLDRAARIWGLAGTGKTTLARHAAEWLLRTGRIVDAAFVDFTRAVGAEYALTQMSATRCSSSGTTSRCSPRRRTPTRLRACCGCSTSSPATTAARRPRGGCCSPPATRRSSPPRGPSRSAGCGRPTPGSCSTRY